MISVPLVMFPDGSLVRTTDIPKGGIIVEETEEYDPSASFVVDQTAAVLEAEPRKVKPTRATFDV